MTKDKRIHQISDLMESIVERAKAAVASGAGTFRADDVTRLEKWATMFRACPRALRAKIFSDAALTDLETHLKVAEQALNEGAN